MCEEGKNGPLMSAIELSKRVRISRRLLYESSV